MLNACACSLVVLVHELFFRVFPTCFAFGHLSVFFGL